MSFPPSNHEQRDILRRAIHSSLQDVLMEVALDTQRGAPLAPTQPLPLTTQDLPTRTSVTSLATNRIMNSSLLASRQSSSSAYSLGLAPSPASVRPPTHLGLNADSLLLSAARASLLLDQNRSSLIEQRIEQERKRLLIENSCWSMLGDKMSKPKSTTNLPNGLHYPPQATSKFAPSASLAVAPKKITSALAALGSSLRSKTDPYIDVANVQDPNHQDIVLRRTRGGVSEPFPEKMHRMLKETEEEGNSDIVSFFSHGRAFCVHDIDRFVTEIMPRYFKQSRWNSFARQLNLYGFIRITKGPGAGGYYHELFLKGRVSLSYHMRRVGVPQGGDRRKLKASNNTPEPDFYSMKKITA